MGKGRAVFFLALQMKVLGNCEDPKNNPKEFGIFKVKAVSGEVQAADRNPFSTDTYGEWQIGRQFGDSFV